MNKRTAAVFGCLFSLAALVAWGHFVTAGINDPPQLRLVAPGIEFDVPATAAAAGLNYATSFEPGEGFSLGYISNGGGTPAGCGGVAFPCWGHTTASPASLITPTIENFHPASGLQHLRLSYDPALRETYCEFQCSVDARFPRGSDVSARPIAANSVSLEVAISNPGGMNYRIQTQSNSFCSLATSALFMYDGSIHVLDDKCGEAALNFINTGAFWDTTGSYQNYTVINDWNYYVNYYYYGGAAIYMGCLIAGGSLEQFLVFGDNYPGSVMDIDNLVLQSYDKTLADCFDGIAQSPIEQCDGADDANCPGRCIEPGQPGACTCIPICTQENPCPVTNGANGPYITSSGYYLYSGASPSISIDTCGSSFDSILSVTTAAASRTPLASNDDCNAGQFGAGADESASCYDGVPPFSDSSPSCTCLTNPGQPILIHFQVNDSGCRPPLVGDSTTINIRKKSVCEGASVGACCDTNGPDVGCTDNVSQANCAGADKVWTDQGKCASTHCECIRDCTGATCGDDGCGGSCGTCGDNNACNGVETCENRNCVAGTPLSCNDGNACNGVESCIPTLGCWPGTPLWCDNNITCDGVETCNPSSGCVSGTPFNCDDGQECSVDTCNEPDGACSHNDSGCSIPTISEWGLAVLTMLLLVAAKVQFGRRMASG